jgi:hypothetical protein
MLGMKERTEGPIQSCQVRIAINNSKNEDPQSQFICLPVLDKNLKERFFERINLSCSLNLTIYAVLCESHQPISLKWVNYKLTYVTRISSRKNNKFS